MKYLLDTDVVSQLSKPIPHAAAYAWIQSRNDPDVFLSAVTLFELQVGVEKMKPVKNRTAVEAFVRIDVPQRFRDRILPVDTEVSTLAGNIFWRSVQNKIGMDSMDAMIAATARYHSMVLATLNRKHFEWLGMPLVTF